MDITIVREYDFTPEWNENRKAVKPVVFKMRRLTTSERDKLISYDVMDGGKIALKTDRQGLFLTAVMGIENLSVNGEPVKTGRDMLSKPGLDTLFIEAVSDIMGQNGREDLKNS